MRRRQLRILITVALLGILAGGYWWLYGRSRQTSKAVSAGPQGDQAEGSVAEVKTVPIRKGTIGESITAYGETIPAPGAMHSIALPFESQVRHILVSDGQNVSLEDLLLEVEPSPDTRLQFEQARNSYELVKQAFDHMQQRFDLKLATNDQLLQAEEAFQQAGLKLESMRKRGIGGQQQIRSDVAGLISKVHVKQGEIVPAGHALVEIVAQNRLEVRLGVEPEDINRVRSEHPVLISRVNAPVSGQVMARVRKIARSVNPTTRLIDVFVSLPSSAQFLLGESILGKLVIASAQGIIVPRSAVLPEDGHYVLFVVRKNRAVKRIVKIGLTNEKEVEVEGAGFQPGEPVVVLGNYELRDGMAVKTGGTR